MTQVPRDQYLLPNLQVIRRSRFLRAEEKSGPYQVLLTYTKIREEITMDQEARSHLKIRIWSVQDVKREGHSLSQMKQQGTKVSGPDSIDLSGIHSNMSDPFQLYHQTILNKISLQHWDVYVCIRPHGTDNG